MTITERLRIPPYAYRLIARVPSRPMRVAEIASASGLSARTINRLSGLQSWAEVTISTADRFIMACGYDPLDQKRALTRLRRILASKGGWKGTRHLGGTGRLSLVDSAQRSRHLRRIEKLLK